MIFEKFVILTPKGQNIVVSPIWLKFCTQNSFCAYNLKMKSIFEHFVILTPKVAKRAKYCGFSDLAEIFSVEFENEVYFWKYCNFDPKMAKRAKYCSFIDLAEMLYWEQFLYFQFANVVYSMNILWFLKSF